MTMGKAFRRWCRYKRAVQIDCRRSSDRGPAVQHLRASDGGPAVQHLRASDGGSAVQHLHASERGFTLIEVMIALFILVLIGVTTSKAVIEAAKLKEVLKDETEFASEFRTSMGFIERDLNQVFNPRWFLSADHKALDPFAQPVAPTTPAGGRPVLTNEQLNRLLKGTAFQAYDYWGPVQDQSGIRASRFKADDKSMSFISASHLRIYQQKKESLYAKVKYELIPMPENPDLTKEQNLALRGLFTLVKHENPRAFELEEPREATYVNHYTVLNRIQKLTFSYYKVGEKDPVKAWDSESQDLKGQFPEAVEVAVSLKGPKGKTMDAKVLFKLEAPNDLLPKTY